MRDDIKRILVTTKYRFIGDTLNAIPTLRAVKERWPHAEVSLLSGARACELLQNCPFVDKFIEFDPYRTSDKGLKQYVRLLGLLRRQRYDLCLILNRSFHSALTAALAGSRKRAGWSGFEGRDFLLSELSVYDRDKPEAECFLDVYRTVGGHYDKSPDLQLWVTNEEFDQAAEHLPNSGYLIGIQPGATHDYKQWPLEKFVETCELLLHEVNNTKIVLIGGPDEENVANKFIDKASQSLSDRTTNLVGRLSLRSTLAAVSHLNAFVGNDTAIRHAAIAIDTPSIGLFGPTSWSKWGNAKPPRHVVLHAPSGKMEDITVESVLGIVTKWQANLPEPVAAGATRIRALQQHFLEDDQRNDRAVSDVQFLLERGTNE